MSGVSNVIGSAFISIQPDTSKTTAATVTGLTTAGSAGGKALSKGIASGATEGTQAAGTAFSKFSQTAATSLGPAFAPIADIQNKFQGLTDSIKTNGIVSAQGLTAIGTAGLGAGIALQAMGSSDASSLAQLKASIHATGQEFSDYSSKIDDAVKHNEQFGITESQTNTALQSLVTVTGDTGQALDLMQTAADLAAAKHMSLAGAAQLVGRAAEGNTRLFKLYGIQVQTNADGTKNIQGALDELSGKLNGQAAASVDSFTGHLRVLGAEVEDHIAKFGQRYGPAITAAGAAMGLFGGLAQLGSKAIDLMRGSTEAATLATQADTAATGLSAAAIQVEASTAAEAQVAEGLLAGAEGKAAAGATVQAAASTEAAAANAELAASSDAAASGGLLKMAAGAGIAGIAVVGVGLVVSHFMEQSKKEAQAGKVAFDAFWQSVSANRNQNSIVDLQAEAADLQAKITATVDDVNAKLGNSGAPDSLLKKLDASITKGSDYAKQLDQLNGQIKTMQGNVSDLASEFGINAQQVQDLADANNINLGGSYDGLEKKFQTLLGGTATQISQLAALGIQYGATSAQISDFAKAQSVTLDGSAKSTAAFQAAQASVVLTGSTFQDLTSKNNDLYSSLSSVTSKLSDFKGILDDIIGTNLSAQQATDAVQKSINDLAASLDKTTHSLVGNSDAVIGNRTALDDIITKMQDAASAQYKQNGSIGDAVGLYNQQYSALVAQAQAQGISKQALDDYLQSLGALPGEVASSLSQLGAVGNSAGQATISGLTSGLMSPEQQTALAQASGSVVTILGNGVFGPLYATGTTAGVQMAQGIYAGMSSAAADAAYANAAAHAASAVKTSFNAAARIQSPSLMMAESGSMLTLGIAQGITAPSAITAVAHSLGTIVRTIAAHRGALLGPTAPTTTAAAGGGGSVSVGGVSIPLGAPVDVISNSGLRRGPATAGLGALDPSTAAGALTSSVTSADAIIAALNQIAASLKNVDKSTANVDTETASMLNELTVIAQQSTAEATGIASLTKAVVAMGVGESAALSRLSSEIAAGKK